MRKVEYASTDVHSLFGHQRNAKKFFTLAEAAPKGSAGATPKAAPKGVAKAAPKGAAKPAPKAVGKVKKGGRGGKA